MVTVPLRLASATALRLRRTRSAIARECQMNPTPAKSRQIRDQRCRAASARRRPERGFPRAPDSGWEPRTPCASRRRHLGKPGAGGRCAQEHAIAHGDGSMRRLSGFSDGVTDACGMVPTFAPPSHGGSALIEKPKEPESRRNPGNLAVRWGKRTQRCAMRCDRRGAPIPAAAALDASYFRPMQLA
jgi:hypothetical protein